MIRFPLPFCGAVRECECDCINPALPWRLNHKHLNIRMREDRFRELFEEIKEGM